MLHHLIILSEISNNLGKKNRLNVMAKVKKCGRFDGLTEDEVKKKDSLPDYLQPNLDIVVVGINPSLMAAHKGRYYAGPGNHFYKLLHASELVPRFVGFDEDSQLLEYKIGLTNIVDRATRSSADLTKAEIKEGCHVVAKKLKLFKPKIAVFNGKCIYQVFAESLGVKKFDFGVQFEKIADSFIWVVPSSSARCSNFPRMNDKLHFYQAIKRHLQFLKGEIDDPDIKDFYLGGKYTQVVSVSKQINKKKISSNTRPMECPQFVVMEIHDGSNKNRISQSVDPNIDSDENEESNDRKKFNQENSESNIQLDTLNSLHKTEKHSLENYESDEEDTEYLINLLKRKKSEEEELIVRKKEMKTSTIADIHKSLGRFMFKKKI